MRIPEQLRKGDSASWVDDPTTDNLGNSIDSSSWTLKYALRGATALVLTATAEGSGWKTSITTTQSSALTAGVYYWQAYAESGSDRVTIGSGKVEILANLGDGGSTVVDGRSQAQQDLEAVQSAIRALISGGTKAYTIGGRSLTKVDLPDLIQRETMLKQEVAREKRAEDLANGIGSGRNIYVRFK